MSELKEPDDQDINTGRPSTEDPHDGPGLTSTPSPESSRPDTPGLPGCPESGEGGGLLALPWEMVSQIASHLPAQCVLSVLPKVCRALGTVGEDTSSWQLRAGRLTGSGVRFPVGPREACDWPRACLEMEELIACWADQADWVARHDQAAEDGERTVGGAQVGLEEEGEGEVGRLAVEEEPDAEGFGILAPVADPGAVDGAVIGAASQGESEMLLDGRRADSDERGRQEEEAAAVAMVEEERRDERGGLLDAMEERGGEGGARPRDGGGGAAAVVEAEPLRSLSPPPALERVPLPAAGHYAHVNAVLLLGGEGGVCASGSRDTNVILWDLHGGRHAAPRMLSGQGLTSSHRGWVWCLASQGPLLASGSFDSTIRLWDLGAGGAESGLISTSAPVLCLSCLPHMLLAGTFNKTVSLYDTRSADPLVKTLQLHGKAVMCLAADDQYIVSGSQDYTVAVYDRRACKTLKRLRLRSYLLSMCYLDGEVWAGDNKGILHAFSLQSGSLKALSQFHVGHTSLVTGVHKSPGSLYTCSSDRTLKVHIPCAPPRTLCTLNYPEGVSGLSVEAGVLAVASGEASVEVWRPRR